MENLTEPLIRVEHLYFKYPGDEDYILKDINFEIYSGEYVVISGPRGEGKSTLLKILAGILPVENGNLFYNNLNLKGVGKKKLMKFHRKTSFVFQDSALISNLNVFDNIALPLRYNEIYPEEEIHRKVENFIKIINMECDKNQLPAFISIGQRKLVSLARALIVEPETIFYDEPIANLDKASRDLVLNLINERNKKGVTSIIVAHELEEFEPYWTKFIELKDRTVHKILKK
jgi:ABC-type lipoprotein export system ATPase subunit